MIRLNLLLLAGVCFFIGCVIPGQQTVNWQDSKSITNAIKVEYDEFKKTTKYTGPYHPNRLLASNIFIRAWKTDDDPSKVRCQIYVDAYYRGDWRFYDHAYDSDGNRLDVTLIDRSVISCSGGTCSHSEDIGVNVDIGYLKKHASSGIRFKVVGRGGEEVFVVPSPYINAFIERLNI
jgi:hypothetical protein